MVQGRLAKVVGHAQATRPGITICQSTAVLVVVDAEVTLTLPQKMTAFDSRLNRW